jgi:hypothetical protein
VHSPGHHLNWRVTSQIRTNNSNIHDLNVRRQNTITKLIFACRRWMVVTYTLNVASLKISNESPIQHLKYSFPKLTCIVGIFQHDWISTPLHLVMLKKSSMHIWLLWRFSLELEIGSKNIGRKKKIRKHFYIIFNLSYVNANNTERAQYMSKPCGFSKFALDCHWR